MSFSFGRPSCELCLALRLAAQLADMPCVALGAQLADVRASLLFALRTCVGVPNLRRALRCVGEPNLRTCLVLRLGAQLADVPCVALGCPTLVRPYCNDPFLILVNNLINNLKH
jgi:hypothetical protein